MSKIGAVLVGLACTVLLSQAGAAPPTVTPSPGYDARLQESRTAQANEPPLVSHPLAAPIRRHPRRIHRDAH